MYLVWLMESSVSELGLRYMLRNCGKAQNSSVEFISWWEYALTFIPP